jgi:hypothetical protein
MSESSKIREGGKAARKAGRRRRLAAALRENLKRRKAQAKRRAAAETAPPAGMHTGLNPSLDSSAEPHDSAGTADDKSSR